MPRIVSKSNPLNLLRRSGINPQMKLISWNVNGIRAAGKKGLPEFVWREKPDILCLQETKAHREQVEPPLVRLGDGDLEYESYWSEAKRKGYSGVATFIRKSQKALHPAQVDHGIGLDVYDSEGRIVVTDHTKFLLYNIYFPNGGSGPERHQYKQEFLRDLVKHLKPVLKRGQPVIITGDYNVAHRNEDVYDPAKLDGESGFMPEERAWFDAFLELGFIDSFRHKNPEARNKFTWWSMIERGRLGNRGWRIDYFCVTPNLASAIRRADIYDQVEISDHAPIVLELEI